MSFDVKKWLAIFYNAYSTLFSPPFSPYGTRISKSIFIAYGWFPRTRSHMVTLIPNTDNVKGVRNNRARRAQAVATGAYLRNETRKCNQLLDTN